LSTIQEIRIPDIGGATGVDVIELLVKVGDHVAVDSSLLTLEGDKATMEIPSPLAGVITEIKVKVGDKVSQDSVIMLIDSAVDGATKSTSAKTDASTAKKAESAAGSSVSTTAPHSPASTVVMASPSPVTNSETTDTSASSNVHAGPAVRRIAREFNIDLMRLTGSGEKNRITKEDIQGFVKTALARANQSSSGGLIISSAPVIDFSKFGAIETKPLNKIKKLTGINLHRSWVTVPHVTQFGQADITELEAFRKQQQQLAEKQGVKLTPLVFIMKAVVAALKTYPQFNSSLDANGKQLILKHYFNLGVAVDTPNGLVVPVVRGVDKKGLFTLAAELAQISSKARDKGLSVTEMQGGSFTISSLGGIGGTAFTPIINTPEVAILGVSKASIQPVYQQSSFVPRLQLPLSLSYDHRVIDGADGARFITYIAEKLSDIRTLLL